MDQAITLPSPEECPGKKMSRARRPRKGAGARLDSTRRHPSSSDRKLARIQLFKLATGGARSRWPAYPLGKDARIAWVVRPARVRRERTVGEPVLRLSADQREMPLAVAEEDFRGRRRRGELPHLAQPAFRDAHRPRDQQAELAYPGDFRLICPGAMIILVSTPFHFGLLSTACLPGDKTICRCISSSKRI